MSSKDKEKTVESKPTVKVAEKKVLRKKQDTFLDYVMAPRRCFPVPTEGSLASEGYLSKTEPIFGRLAIHALFLREGREDDVKRAPHPDGKPYPPYFILNHESCAQRLACMVRQQKSCDQTKIAVDGWPKDSKEVRPLEEVLAELGLS